jgi:hypothetical protein
MTVRNKIAAAVAALGLLTCATLTSAGAANASPHEPGATLTKATVYFHTNDEDKDDDTHVTLWVRDRANTTAAFISSDFGHFDDRSDNSFALQITNRSSWDILNQGVSTIRIDPNGHDTWHFNVHIDLLFSDGSHLSSDSSGLSLSQDRRQQSWGVQ